MAKSITSFEALSDEQTAPTTIQTTLFDLIAAISDEVGAEEEELVTATVMHLMNSGRLKFTDDPRHIEIVFP